MRLVCPNCDAAYEVADDAIPEQGRDVQCSNCGHAWFQMSPSLEAEADAEAAVFDPPPVLNRPYPAAEPRPEAAPQVGAADVESADIAEDVDPEPDGPEVFTPPTSARPVDDSVLAVLREEAAREVAARRMDALAGVETQTELPLAAPPSMPEDRGAARHIARMKGIDPDAGPPRLPARRDLLPDIEEINSTLRASNDRAGEPASTSSYATTATAERDGFRSGFVLMMIVAVLLVVTYTMAGRLSVQIPQAAGVLQSYVAGVDAGRLWLDGAMKSVIGMLQGS